MLDQISNGVAAHLLVVYLENGFAQHDMIPIAHRLDRDQHQAISFPAALTTFGQPSANRPVKQMHRQAVSILDLNHFIPLRCRYPQQSSRIGVWT
jgi:hypothetical protein